MRVVPDHREHLSHALTENVVKVHDAQPCVGDDMLLLLATTEEHRYGVAGHVLLLGLGTGGIALGAVAAVVLSEYLQTLVCADNLYHLTDGNWLRVLVGEAIK